MTDAQKRALLAVERGDVQRVYRGDGNVFKPKKGCGASPLTLRQMERDKLIMDGPTGKHAHWCVVLLSKAGQDALNLSR